MAVFAFVAACGAASAFAAPPPPLDPLASAAEMKSAKGPRIVEIRNDVVAAIAAIPSVIDRNSKGEEVKNSFEPLLADANPDVKLNAAMTIAQLHTLSTDAALERMLADKSPAIRYWAARGLGEIVNLKLVGANAAINALNKALAIETSGIVKKEIIHAISKLGDVKAMVDSLGLLATSLQAAAPDQDTLEAASSALTELHNALKAGPLAPKDPKPADIAKTVAWVANLTSQQIVAVKTARAKDGGTLPEGFHATNVGAVNNAMQVLDDLAGKPTFPRFKPETSPEQLLLDLNDVTGSTGLGAGQLQKAFPTVPVPPVIQPAK